jgi:hypothetical protein
MISAQDQERIAYAQDLLDRRVFAEPESFRSSKFLLCAVKHGLLKNTASEMESYELYGKLLQTFRNKRTSMVDVIEALSPTELTNLRETVTGVLPFRGKQ